MVTSIKESKRQDKQQNQIKTRSLSYDQNSKLNNLNTKFRKKTEKVKMPSDER